MPPLQSDRQASVRVVTNTTLDYNGDWSALFDSAGIPAGDWNGRMLAWINQRLSSSYTSLPSAMMAFAVAEGVTNFQFIGTFSASAGAAYVPTYHIYGF